MNMTASMMRWFVLLFFVFVYIYIYLSIFLSFFLSFFLFFLVFPHLEEEVARAEDREMNGIGVHDMKFKESIQS